MKKGSTGNNEPKTSEITDINFIKISMEGPTVSFSGSPTVSPTMVAS
jgi:hypothetical protein